MAKEETDLACQLFNHHERCREPVLRHRRFKHADLQPLVDYYQASTCFNISEAGRSFEGRSIPLFSLGSGPVKVLLWSQMHGDEATATMALFDIFRFLNSEKDGFDDLRELLSEQLTLYFIPMLNPDGAERFQRATAQMIDMNRDALSLQTPEGRILKGLIDDLRPDFGFNLHDQNPRYTAGKSDRLATLSFLATAYDYELSINDVRLRAMQLIGVMNEKMQKFIPGQIGRFNDEHEPRAFGDQIQKSGTSLILVESGGCKDDPEKQFVRKLNFVALLSAFSEIARGSYIRKNRQDYEAIPLNERTVLDLIVRGVVIESLGTTFHVDIGINREEVNTIDAKGFYYEASIEELGDLHTKYGLEETAADLLVFTEGRMYPHMIKTNEELERLDVPGLFFEGYIFFRVSEPVAVAIEAGDVQTPVHWLRTSDIAPSGLPRPGERATFLLGGQGGAIRYAIVNGFVFHRPDDVRKQR